MFYISLLCSDHVTLYFDIIKEVEFRQMFYIKVYAVHRAWLNFVTACYRSVMLLYYDHFVLCMIFLVLGLCMFIVLFNNASFSLLKDLRKRIASQNQLVPKRSLYRSFTVSCNLPALNLYYPAIIHIN